MIPPGHCVLLFPLLTWYRLVVFDRPGKFILKKKNKNVITYYSNARVLKRNDTVPHVSMTFTSSSSRYHMNNKILISRYDIKQSKRIISQKVVPSNEVLSRGRNSGYITATVDWREISMLPLAAWYPTTNMAGMQFLRIQRGTHSWLQVRSLHFLSHHETESFKIMERCCCEKRK